MFCSRRCENLSFVSTVITNAFFSLGVDAYRVVSGAEMLAGNIIDPKDELVFTKLFELFAESIPGKLNVEFQLISRFSLTQFFTFSPFRLHPAMLRSFKGRFKGRRDSATGGI